MGSAEIDAFMQIFKEKAEQANEEEAVAEVEKARRRQRRRSRRRRKCSQRQSYPRIRHDRPFPSLIPHHIVPSLR